MIFVLLVVVSGCTPTIGPGDTTWNEFVAPFRHDADVGGYKLHYIDMGQGAPVVMVHGYADSTYCWHNNLRPLLDAGYRVVLVDQPGLGRSEIPPDPYTYTAANQVEAILTLVRGLGFERYAMVGSSMGGGETLYVLAAHPELVSKAIVISPGCYPMDPPMMTHLPGTRYLAETSLGKSFVGMSLRQVYADAGKVNDALIDEYSRPLLKKGYGAVLSRLIRDYSHGAEGFIERYKEITTPVLIIWGDEDRWVPPAFGPRLHADLPNSRLETIPGSGHLAHQESPDVVNPMMLEFLNAP